MDEYENENENEIKLKAIAVLTGLRSGVGSDFVSALISEVTPSQFLVPADADAAEIGRAMLEQLSGPWSALISGFVQAFEAVADAYDEVGPETSTEDILQALALELASASD
ncbi:MULTISPECIES: hypothetical protein [unclassified Streptomyces]|uniref:hypothetical protein n=1 Tax=unclassified Streptomyces TaxID=2593676 RepID=UPI001BE67B72|nr:MULTISPECIES: hypothetical protein [unclassified Streptomyces]MBT2405241.1 hypothetical protein [Streptomyces sp. ISL-21]MBT2611009.1 hypothetical protein [Streptomyces sp. ISL-87]